MTPAETDIGVMTFALGKLADLLHEGKRFPEIAELRCALDAAGIIAQLPIRSPAPGSAGPHRAEAAEHRHDTACMFSRRDFSVMCLAPNLIEATAGQPSAIDLSEHDVERADDRRDVGKHVPAA